MRIVANEIAKAAPYANRKLAELIDTYTYGNVTEFAKMTCMSQQRISNLIKNKGTEDNPKYSKVTEEVKEAIIQTFDLPQNTFINMTPYKDVVDPVVPFAAEGGYEYYPLQQDKGDDKHKCLPLIPDKAMAGALSGTSNSYMEYECEKYIVPVFTDADFLIRVQGDSMMPKYMPGDIVACKKIQDRIWFQWGKTYILDTRQGALIKRIEQSENEGNIKLVSENTKYAPFDLPSEEIFNVALVKGVIRVE